MNKPAIYFVITIDTEADHSPDWRKSQPLSFRSITEAVPSSLQPLFKKHGAVATYLLTAEVLENAGAVRVLKDLGACELGTHLHPEYVEPQKKYIEYAGTWSSEFSSNYSADIERQKIAGITELFLKKIGHSPVVYRGGRFGFSENTALSLAGLGYLVDTSVTPCVSWRDNIGGPDFKKSPDQPYFIKDANRLDRLLEVPVSILFLNPINKIFNHPTWLRPSFSSYNEMKRLIDQFIAAYRDRDTVVLNMMFHSMEFYPNASPYARNREDCSRLLEKLGAVIEYCGQIGAVFYSLSQIRVLYQFSRGSYR